MEITKLDSPDDDGLLERLAILCERIDDLLDRMARGESVDLDDVTAVGREAVSLGIEKNINVFRPFVAALPVVLN